MQLIIENSTEYEWYNSNIEDKGNDISVSLKVTGTYDDYRSSYSLR
jgi:hypothetical protein